MSLLEDRYRFVLRLLPAAYREAWEEDMVAAFLESTGAGDPGTDALVETGRPGLAEIGSVVSLAVRLRLGGPDAPPRSRTWGEAVRRATVMVTLAHAVMACGGIAASIWLSGRIGWLPQPAPAEPAGLPETMWRTAGNLTAWAWMPAYLALLLGRRRTAQALALLAVAAPALSVVTWVAAGTAPLPLVVAPLAMLADGLLLIMTMAAFPEGTPVGRRGRWLLAWPAGIVLVPLPLITLQALAPATRLADWPGVACLLVAAAAALYQAGGQVRRTPGALPSGLALTLVAAATAGQRLLTLPGSAGQTDRASLLVLGLAQVAVLLAVAAPLAVTTLRTFRQLPPLTASTTATTTATTPVPDAGTLRAGQEAP